MFIFVQLQPEVVERIGRIVRISNGFRAYNPLIFVINLHINDVIGFLLPVLVPRRARGGPVHVRVGQQGAQLLKFISMVGSWVIEVVPVHAQTQETRGQKYEKNCVMNRHVKMTYVRKRLSNAITNAIPNMAAERKKVQSRRVTANMPVATNDTHSTKNTITRWPSSSPRLNAKSGPVMLLSLTNNDRR